MASGLPYDSEQGREVSAAITSLMTGTAYRRSAELAGIVGPYDGYARNAEPHKRVMRKHAAATTRSRRPAPWPPPCSARPQAVDARQQAR
ncbi:hypothetical protein V2I01_23935 [Micromonospora sp. BRA006-A]|nr:hypothetical protein [Micromonospora sp. BRA006-A]